MIVRSDSEFPQRILVASIADTCKIRVSAFVRSEEGAEVQKRIWAELSVKLEKIQPGIMSNI